MRRLLISCGVVGFAISVVACGGAAPGEKTSSAPTGQARPATAAYPEPRYPSYLVQSRTAEDLLPHARRLVRNKIGFQGIGFGMLDEGDSILIVTSIDAEAPAVDAIVAALKERKITAMAIPDYELAGLTRDQVLAYNRLHQSYTSEQGFREAIGWIEAQFADAAATKQWLRSKRSDVYDALFPAAEELPPQLADVGLRLRLGSTGVGSGIVKFLEAHPKVRGVFWGKGGVPWLRRAIHPHSDKMLGLFTADNRFDLVSAISSYPGDVWLLAEETSMEPIAYVDQMDISDPEGTKVTSQIDAEVADRWSRGVYERGHLYLFPNQATGRWGASVVNYPALQENGWLAREPMAVANGVIAGTANHVGFYPRWEVTLRDGYVTGVKGGGVYGDVLRAFLEYPLINDLVIPLHTHKGYWYHYEIGTGTHPKGFRHPPALERGSLLPERLRSGVVHWGLGVTLHASPQSPMKDPAYVAFLKKHNLPADHGFHTHNYFTTYRVHLRNADRWMNLLDKGRLTSLDDPEVRALASRYGNAAELLAEDWIPEIPGINAPGDYSQYAANPWAVAKPIIDRAVAGTYERLYPRPGARGTTH